MSDGEREEAIIWWHNLNLKLKTQYLKDCPNVIKPNNMPRKLSTLTGREINILYNFYN